MVDHDRVISLVQTITADPELLQRLAVTPVADRGAVLSEIGYGDVSPDDVAGAAHLFTDRAVEEIDDEQLASIAGGLWETTGWDTASYPPATVSASAAAAT